VTPEGILFKDLGDSQEFTASAGPGYEIDAWHLDGAVAQVGGTNFTLRDIQDDHAVTVTFTLPDDLAVAKVGPLDPVAVSSNFFYRIFVKNTGTRDTTGVQMTDALPTGITGLSVQSSQGACTLSSNVVTCALGNLARGDSGMIEIQAVAVSEGSFTNVATVRGSAPETNLLNNTSAVVTVAGDSPRILRQPESQTVPARDPVSFTVGAEGTATLRYQWYFNGGYLAGETAATLSIPSAAAGNAGSYVVFVSNDFGIVESAPAILTVQ
jgi:uncharacterized repeat protein (TIGR01451 family)